MTSPVPVTTIFYPDLSVYNDSVDVQPNTVAVCARCTLSTSYYDPDYRKFQQEAANVGAFFLAYHWMNHDNLQAQAEWLRAHAGDTPVMWDVEDMPGNTGYSGAVTVDDIVTITNEYRALGGVVHLVYLPHWYWQDHMGSPDLTPLVNIGLHLVSSNYTTYSDTGPGWVSYGHMTPEDWQYTDNLPYGGGHVDFNAFHGSIQTFISLATGGVATTPPPILTGDVELSHWQTVQQGSTNTPFVRRAQGLLLAAGLSVGRYGIDGDFGPTTAASTRTLQSRMGITVDGIFGPQTFSVASFGHDYTH